MSPGRDATVEVEGRRLVLSNLDKILYPASGFTKGDLLAYYSEIAPVLLPHLAGRPVSVQRFPDGVEGPSFFAKNVPKGAPEWLDSVTVKSGARGGPESTRYPLVDGTAALLYLANLAAIEIHVPMWRLEDGVATLRPRRAPSSTSTPAHRLSAECCTVAMVLREELAELAGQPLSPLPKTSGKKGLQLYCPIPPMAPEKARTLAHEIAEAFADRHPELAVANMRKDLREGKVLIDWSQNVPAKTTVAPYSLRPEAEPSVSTPLTWDEVAGATTTAGAAALRFAPAALLGRVKATGDLFSPLLTPRG